MFFFFACGFSLLYLPVCANLAGSLHNCRLEAEKRRPVIRGTIPETDPLPTLEDDLSSSYRAHLRLTFLLLLFFQVITSIVSCSTVGGS